MVPSSFHAVCTVALEIWIALPLLTILVCVGSPTLAAQSLLEESLVSYRSAVESVMTYDVYLTVEQQSLLKRERTFPRGKANGNARQPQLTFRPYDPGERPPNVFWYSRQISTANGRRRFERHKSHEFSEDAVELSVFDGVKTSSLSASTKSVSMRPWTPNTHPIVQGFESFECLFRSPIGLDCGGFDHLFSVRSGITAHLDEKDGWVVVTVPHDPSAKSLRKYSWRIELDPDRAMMPRRIEVYGKNKEHPKRITEVIRFAEPKPGLWVPASAKTTHYTNESAYAEFTFDVDLERSRWNEPMSEGLFCLNVPAGYRVHDATSNSAYVAGAASTTEHLEALAASGRDVVDLDSQRRVPFVQKDRSHVVVGLNLALIVMLSFFVWRRHRKNA